MAGVLVKLTCHLGHGDDGGELIGEGRGIVDGEFIVDGIGTYAGKSLREHFVFGGAGGTEARGEVIEITGYDYQGVTIPVATGIP